ncbi:hypothetical protein ACLB1R_16485 [Escherichia coli]
MLADIDAMAVAMEEVATVPGACACRASGRRALYYVVNINREAARYGMTVADVQSFVIFLRWAGRWLAKRRQELPVIQLSALSRKAGAIVRRHCASCRF